MSKPKKGRVEKHNKWGYIFLIPFILTYVIFQLIPLISTIYNSFFENYSMGLIQVGPNYIGLENYASLFESGKLLIYLKNTMIMWVLGFVPQILLSLLLGAWFSDTRLKLKASGFFKTVIYLPNLIMASAFAMLFFALFSDNGPVNAILLHVGLIKEKYSFLSHAGSARGLVGFMNFLMCLCIGVTLFGCSPFIPQIYNTSVEVKNLASSLLRISACMLPIISLYYSSYFTMRAGGKTLLTFFFDSGYTFIFTFMVALCLTRFTDLPILNVYLLVQCVDIPKAILGITLVKKGIWIHNIVNEF